MGSYHIQDNSDVLQRMQQCCCGDRLGALWRVARDRYVAAERTLGIDTELGRAARTARSFDHRTLEYLHDLIAASFRCRYAERLQPDLPGVLCEVSYEERIRSEWIGYFAAECDALAESHHDFPKLVLEATVCPNLDQRRKQAEEALAGLVEDRYADLDFTLLRAVDGTSGAPKE